MLAMCLESWTLGGHFPVVICIRHWWCTGRLWCWLLSFLGLIFGLTHWWHLLMGAKHKVKVSVDHANLTYYRHPQKVNWQVAHYIATLADYDINLVHRAGKLNKADALSRQPDYNNGHKDNADITALPDNLFVRHLETLDIHDCIQEWHVVNTMSPLHPALTLIDGVKYYRSKIFVPEDLELWWELLKVYHDTISAGHPGASLTLASLEQDYWWPQMNDFIQSYVKGCAMCQYNKSDTHPNKPPMFPISVEAATLPFQTVTVDWITKLPLSNGYDSILTITNHNCSKAMIFILCNEASLGEKMVELYIWNVAVHFGIPWKLISDHDPCLTSEFFQLLCDLYGIWWNISTTYHPQTDGQSEQTNQTLETFIRIFCNEQQSNWASLLPIAQYSLNCQPSHMTHTALFKALMGYIPMIHQNAPISHSPNQQERIKHVFLTRQRIQANITLAQEQMIKLMRFRAYAAGDKVWIGKI